MIVSKKYHGIDNYHGIDKKLKLYKIIFVYIESFEQI